ncbi:ISL3 family transposase [Mycobacterium aquaticum]|uniref:ISL3 family transposase n=1 Tax=Mycobacterium aquaticum TaxID=1927124 RepID=A0A1X0B3Z1_9MYCO|nr:ISL3 family transposase [Mycobacterium aquaticum]ORA36929.1 ISL3 family transposase [Mycobacterium aquaticum]
MRNASLWRAVLCVQDTVIEDVAFDEAAQVVVVHVRPRRAVRGRCGACGARAGRYDRGQGRRRWRTLDLGTVEVFLETDVRRVNCATHGPTVCQVPWARHGAGHTRVFDAQVAWLATHCSKRAITELMRIAWRTVGSIIARVWADTASGIDAFADLTRIGIDEISYKRHHKYLTVVVDHDSGRLVWASPGRDKATVNAFFDALEASAAGRCAQITRVSADGAEWIADVVAERCPEAIRCADPFHVVSWANEALDEVRRQAWNAARRAGHTQRHGWVAGRRVTVATGAAKALKRTRFALWKNPENLSERQRAKLEWIAKTDPRLYRAYLLKEALRTIFKLLVEQAAEALDKWVAWARRCRLESFVLLQQRITRHRRQILASIEHGLSNGLLESANTKIRLLTRMAFGFATPEPIALAMLTLGGHRPALPGRH